MYYCTIPLSNILQYCEALTLYKLSPITINYCTIFCKLFSKTVNFSVILSAIYSSALWSIALSLCKLFFSATKHSIICLWNVFKHREMLHYPSVKYFPTLWYIALFLYMLFSGTVNYGMNYWTILLWNTLKHCELFQYSPTVWSILLFFCELLFRTVIQCTI